MPTPESNKSRYVIPDDTSPSGIRCVTVPVPDDPQWIAQFLGAIWRLSLQTHYERDEAKSGTIVAARWRQVWNEVQMALCGCGAGGDIIRINTVNNFRFNIQNVFNVSGLDGVAPDRPDDKWDADTGDAGDEVQQRQNALCLAVLDYVHTIAEDSWRRAVGMSILDVATTFPITFLASPINGLIYWGALALLTKARIDALNSQSVRETIACCLKEALEGIVISEASFNTALNGCGFAGGSDEELAREIIVESMQDQTNWLLFVRSLGAYFNAAGAGAADCPCDGFTHTFDFTAENDGWTDRAEDSRPYGTYSPGVGWISEYAGAAEALPDDERLYVQKKGWSSRTIIKVQMFFDTTGVQGGSGRDSGFNLLLGGVFQSGQAFGNFDVPGSFFVEWVGSEAIDEIESWMVGDASGDNSQFVLTKCVVVGLGSDPF